MCLRRYDVPNHRQDRVDPLHSFNPFILFTGPDEVFGTHRCPGPMEAVFHAIQEVPPQINSSATVWRRLGSKWF